MTDDNPISRRRFLYASAATTAVAVVPSTAAAQPEIEESNRIALFFAAMNGKRKSWMERAWMSASGPPAAEQTALDAKEEFNQNADEWVDYVNKYSDLSGDVQVIEIQFVPDTPDDDETYDDVDTGTVYLVADHNGDEYTSAEIVETTDREVDEKVRLESIAAKNAADEIEEAYEKFVKPDEPPAESHLAHLAAKYKFGTDHVTSTILGEEL